MDRPSAKVLILEDQYEALTVLESALRDKGYRVYPFLRCQLALGAIVRVEPDLVLLDVSSPETNVYEVCAAMKGKLDSRDIPVMFLGGSHDVQDKMRAFNVGCVDYITKPYHIDELLARVDVHLQLKNNREVLRKHNVSLIQLVREQTQEITAAHDITIYSLALLAEYRDNETGSHIMRTQRYMVTLCERLRTHARFARELSAEFIDMLYKTTPLHDIGKVGTPDYILTKPDVLTADEFEIMKLHTVHGKEVLTKAQFRFGGGRTLSFIRTAIDIISSHHEKWDGSGYPQGLKGENIPLAGRLMAVCDIYDALISRRVYKESYSHEVAVRILTKGDGRVLPSHFDPDILDAFEATQEVFREIACGYADANAQLTVV